MKVNRLALIIVLLISLAINILFFYIYSSPIRRVVLSYFNRKTVSEDSSRRVFTFTNGHELTVLGKYHNERNYNRLPAAYRNIVRNPVWIRSEYSAGIAVAFRTNSQAIGIRWKVKSSKTQSHMTKIVACGVDLYCYRNGKWQYVNSGIPDLLQTDCELISGMDSTMKDFIINLPLYDVTESIEIGIESGARIYKSDIINRNQKIVFYGTSITQGASASRPGMNYPAIISRRLNTEVINLGFSMNGKFENSIGEAICEINTKLIVLDCTPNSSPEVIRENVPNLLAQLRACKPSTPILMVESIMRAPARFNLLSIDYIKRQNNELKNAYQNAIGSGVSNLHYINSEALIGEDFEATIDGTHLTDLGMFRIAEAVQFKINDILK